MEKITHIAIIVSSEKSISFYELLGFEVIERIKRENDEIVFLKCDQINLELFIDSKHPKRQDRPEQMGLRHFGIIVDDLEEKMKTLTQNGIAIDPLKEDWHGRRYTVARDPDGLPIEITE